jgi:serine/threonine protein kinase
VVTRFSSWMIAGRPRQAPLVALMGPEAQEGYERLGQLGQGQYGKVMLATQRSTGRKVAIKEFNQERESFEVSPFPR